MKLKTHVPGLPLAFSGLESPHVTNTEERASPRVRVRPDNAGIITRISCLSYRAHTCLPLGLAYYLYRYNDVFDLLLRRLRRRK